MTELLKMPIVTVEQVELARFGERWLNNGSRLTRTPPQSSTQLGGLFDIAVGASLSTMLGGIPVVLQGSARVKAPTGDCIEVGGVTLRGGFTPQTFDVGYRPDGVRFAFNSKTLNDRKSLQKNWQNMINDLLAEATNVHSQFKSAIMAFIVAIPTPCFIEPQMSGIIRRLERLAGRARVEDPVYMAEAISLVIWNPEDGRIESDVPARESPLRLERFAEQVENIYASRYTNAAVIHKDEPPHKLEETGHTRQLKVFICHSSEDKPEVRDLYRRLKQYKGIQPWLDEIDLLPGHDWDLEIKRAVKNADVILVCLSRSSVTKKGYVQKEIRYALDVADEQPEGSIFLIPLRLEECEVPERLRNRQWVDYFSPVGHERLISALQRRASELGVTIRTASVERVSTVTERNSTGSSKAKSIRSKKDRTRNDKGILLEQVVAMLHKAEGVTVETNVFLPPKSGDQSRTREIDVLLTGEVAGYPVRVAIQCKNYGTPVTIGQIGEFRDLLEDVGLPPQYGIIVSVNGYQAGATKRAKELGIKALVLEGLDETRLKAEIKDTFQFFVYLMLVVEDMHIRTEIADSYLAFCFWEEDNNIIGWFTDLIVTRWRNGEIPTTLGEYPIDLTLPQGWYQTLGDKIIHPTNLEAKVRVVAYLAEMTGKLEEYKLKEADTDKIEKFHLQANFDVLNNLIKSSHEEPIFTEEELKKLKKDATASIENRIRLPKIFVRNHLEPISKKAFDKLMEGTENLSKEEIEKLPQLKFEEVEGFGSMQEVPFLGEPVIIPTDSGDLIDVRLLLRKGKFDEVIDLLPYLEKFPRPDFAQYLAMALLSQGEVLLKRSLTEEPGIKKALEAQAFNSFDRSIQISPNPIDAYNSLGVVFGKNGLYDKALECFNWVLSVQPQDEIARHNLEETYSRMGKSSK